MALVGQTPLSESDKLIYRGLHLISPSPINPDERFPLGPPAPENAPSESRALSMTIGTAFAVALVVIITVSRLVIRKFYLKAFRADDWVIIPGALACVAYLGLHILAETRGCLGKHLYHCTYDELNIYLMTIPVNEVLFYICVFTVKASIALQNQRISGMTSKTWRYTHYAYLTLVLLLLPTTVCLNLFQCTPVAVTYSLRSLALLDDPKNEVKCLGRVESRMQTRISIKIATRSLHVITDVALLFVPLFIIYRLQASLGKKLRIGFLFCIGLVSFLATIMRNVKINTPSVDATWDNYDVHAWDVVDVFFATIVASLPAFNNVLSKIIKYIKSFKGDQQDTQRTNLSPFLPPPAGPKQRYTPRGLKRASSKSVSTFDSKYTRTEDELRDDLRMLGDIHRKIHIYEFYGAGMEGYRDAPRNEEGGFSAV